MFVRPGLKSLPGTNSLAYCKNSLITIVKSFITLASGGEKWLQIYPMKTFFG
jgi:hypothetical protein